jgi:antitoxin (DNA-binding transcriptional repressor) of toxin-antitoxin stability system
MFQFLIRAQFDINNCFVSAKSMTDITAEELQKATEQLLARASRGERFGIIRNGNPEAYLLAVSEAVNAPREETTAELWRAQKDPGPFRPNPILKQRLRRRYAARLRHLPK